MIVALGTDHGGFHLKAGLADVVAGLGHRVLDCGAADATPSDYPDFARAVGESIVTGAAERGILLCGSGVGICIAANKIPGVRAAVCHDTYSARQGVEHDDLNVLCLGARVIGGALADELVTAFLEARFSDEERHRRRLDKVAQIERDAGIARRTPNQR